MDTEQLPRRERERLAHRRLILDAALELFSEKGYQDVSMQEIARRAEFSVGALYSFFRSKEQLYESLVLEMAREHHARLGAVLRRQGEAATVLRGYVAERGRLFSDNIKLVRLYFVETRALGSPIGSAVRERVRELYHELVLEVASLIERGIREGAFREGDPYRMAVALEGMVNAFLFCWLQYPEGQPYESNVDVILDIFMRGVAAGSG